MKKLEYAQKIGNWVSAVILGQTQTLIARIDERTELMMEAIKDMKPKVDDMWPKVDILWKDKYAPANSPRRLNELGEKILEESGVREIIEGKKDRLTEIVRSMKPTTAYDAEQTIFSVVSDIPQYCPEIVNDLKDGAFRVGQNIDTILFVGAIHLRDLIFDDLGFSLDDLDHPKTKPLL